MVRWRRTIYYTVHRAIGFILVHHMGPVALHLCVGKRGGGGGAGVYRLLALNEAQEAAGNGPVPVFSL